MKYDRKKLLTISKSKKGLFDSCRLAFKFNYLDKVEQDDNPFFKIGTNVHNFIDNFFDIVEIDGKELLGVSKLIFHPNTSYKKNVAKFELKRWEAVIAAGKDQTFWKPTVKEKGWTTQNPDLKGYVDRVHKCFPGDVFAPKHPEFKDGDLVIVENKTGKPTAAKCKAYEEDMLWYKIIMEIVKPELAPIRWGAIYFPYDNYVYTCELKTEDCRKLAQSIKLTREQIAMCLDTGMFPASPSPSNCKWCSFRTHCPNSMANG